MAKANNKKSHYDKKKTAQGSGKFTKRPKSGGEKFAQGLLYYVVNDNDQSVFGKWSFTKSKSCSTTITTKRVGGKT